jgi:predicted transcriptional regulator
MTDKINTEIKQKILEFLDTPKNREDIETSLDYSNKKIRSTLREMLYSGDIETTPEWKYENSEQ